MANGPGVIGRSKAIKSYFSRLLLMRMRLRPSRLLHQADLFLVAFGSITLTWVGQLTWQDMTVWGKDIALILFGSRTGENISLGIGMKVIHYFLIGLTLLLLGFITTLQRQSKSIKLNLGHLLRVRLKKEKKSPSGCPHHSGYLASRPKNTPIPQECLICPKILECMQNRDF